MRKHTHPGKNLEFDGKHFTDDENKIINKLSTEWYITNAGGKLELGIKAKYKYFLMKPIASYQELFNIEREIIVVFSDYVSFEPRTLDAFDAAAKKYQDLRIEKICCILISKDSQVESKIHKLLKSDAELQVVIPFTYEELLTYNDAFFIKNRIKSNFYSRDLFAYQSALKRDLYFFGRTDLVHQLVQRHKSFENSGLFGLRKTGKTSIVYGIQRAIKNEGGLTVFIDCQSPDIHINRWYDTLRTIIKEIIVQNHLDIKFKENFEYTEQKAASNFEDQLSQICAKCGKSILLIFDEVEHITPDISISANWRTGNDFILLWQTVRSIFQKRDFLFSYLIVGTNPKCVDMPFINGVDNPIFNQVPYEYIWAFEVDQTKEMVMKIGGIMGLHFDEGLYSKLTDDFGGHPFLIRNVCSTVNKIVPSQRPIRIDKKIYNEAVKIFNRDYGSYIEMILSVLKEYYGDEYEMLKLLALGDMDLFNDFASISKEYTNHLLGYNIIDYNNGHYFYKIESIKDYLITNNKYKKIKLSKEEKYMEISERRNDIEPKLRQIIRTIYVASKGENDGKKIILDIMGDPRKSKYFKNSLKEIFNPNTAEIYLEDLRKFITKEWELFENIFGRDREGFNTYMGALNKYRPEAHAKDISDEELTFFRVCATKIEDYIKSYL